VRRESGVEEAARVVEPIFAQREPAERGVIGRTPAIDRNRLVGASRGGEVARAPVDRAFELARLDVVRVRAQLRADVHERFLELPGREARVGALALRGAGARVGRDRALRRCEALRDVAVHAEEPRRHPLHARVVGARVGGALRRGARGVVATLRGVEPGLGEQELGVVAALRLGHDQAHLVEIRRVARGVGGDEHELRAPQQRRATARLEGQRLVHAAERAVPVGRVLADLGHLEEAPRGGGVGLVERQALDRRARPEARAAGDRDEREQRRDLAQDPCTHRGLPRAKRSTIQRSRRLRTGGRGASG